MPQNITFKDVCNYLKKDNLEIADKLDKFIGVALMMSPFTIGSAALSLLPLLSVKNELIKLSKAIYDSLSKKKEDNYLERQKKMQMAFALICFTSFYEALDDTMTENIRRGMAELDITLFTDSGIETKKNRPHQTENLQLNSLQSLNNYSIIFPRPEESFELQLSHLELTWKELTRNTKEFLLKMSIWDKVSEIEKRMFFDQIENLPQKVKLYFEAQYFELARKYEDFAVWSNLHEHKNSQALITSLSEYIKSYSLLFESTKVSIDVGFEKLHNAVEKIPEVLKVSQSKEIFDSLVLHYKARLDEPIIEEKIEDNDKPALSFPSIKNAFIPQAFSVIRYTKSIKRLEDEELWKGLSRQDCLNSFFINYLSSPYSVETPLIILGHPGSGKSLLTTILSAQLMSQHYTAIRVPLREVNADSSIISQIEESIYKITSISIDSWVKLSGAFKNNPPLVILDGYDELLQASGKVFSGYLKDVQDFQKNEAEQGRPVRIIVTSRITLIDKAIIPHNSLVLRLLEFDNRQQEAWISIWNQINAEYFQKSGIKEFSLPAKKDVGAENILSLSEQPLLLLMLALYDSEKNKLRKSNALDRSILYDSLLRRFIERERDKDKTFKNSQDIEKEKVLDNEMQRLGAAAVGMYNRRKLHILSEELNDDLRFFDLERPISINQGKVLSQAELLLGSFFFVHKSKSIENAGYDEQIELSAFEFLHNTFGEFLVADFLLRQAITETKQLIALSQHEVLSQQLQQRLNSADGLSRQWFAGLIYTPLFSRPVVLEIMREWLTHLLIKEKISQKDFIRQLDRININQLKRLLNKREMPSIMYKEIIDEKYRASFGDYPLLGHIAIYSINLVLQRVIISDYSFKIKESEIVEYEDGTRFWDRLISIWRSWFSVENLNGIAAIIMTDYEGEDILITSKKNFQSTQSQNRLETCHNVSNAIGDSILSGLSGLFLFDPHSQPQEYLNKIVAGLQREKINLAEKIIVKQLQSYQANFSVVNNWERYTTMISEGLEMVDSSDLDTKAEILIIFCNVIFTNLNGLQRRYSHEQLIGSFRQAINPRYASQFYLINPVLVLIIIRVANKIGDWDWIYEFNNQIDGIFYQGFHTDEGSKNQSARLLEFINARIVFQKEQLNGRFKPRFSYQIGQVVEELFYKKNLNKLALISGVSAILLVEEQESTFERLGSNIFSQFNWNQITPGANYYDVELLTPLLKLARRLKEVNFLKLFAKHCFDKIELNAFIKAFEIDPEIIYEWTVLANENYYTFFVNEIENFCFGVSREMGVTELFDNYAKVLLFIINNQENSLKDNKRYEMFANELFERRYSKHAILSLMYRSPLALALLLRIARISHSLHLAQILSEMISSLSQYDDLSDIITYRLPIFSLSDIRWVAENTNTYKKIKRALPQIDDDII